MHHILDALLNGPAHYSVRHHFSPLWTLVFVLGILLAEFIAVYLVGFLIFKVAQNIRPFIGWVLHRSGVNKDNAPKTFLELTFPADTTKSAFATVCYVSIALKNAFVVILHTGAVRPPPSQLDSPL